MIFSIFIYVKYLYDLVFNLKILTFLKIKFMLFFQIKVELMKIFVILKNVCIPY